MDSYYKASSLLRRLFEEDTTNVHTIIHDSSTEIDADIYKANIMPLVQIIPTPAALDPNVTIISFDVTMMNIRDISNDTLTDKFTGQDNFIDNMNMCLGVFRRVMNKLRRPNEFNIILGVYTRATPGVLEGPNLLDGWTMNIELQVPNNVNNACE